MNPTGYILHETADVAIIATVHSENRKTGDMVQVWSLYRHESPVDAVRTGNVAKVCFDCPHVGVTCYVDLSRAPLGIWKAYHRGNYPHLEWHQYRDVFSGRKVRFGAYGESVLIPIGIMRAIAHFSDGWTGYTHQWRRTEFAEYRSYVMASCDSAADAAEATAAGWRHFRVRTESQDLLAGEISCPASEEMEHMSQCIRCGLCNGVRTDARHDSDARKSIAILVHGRGARAFERLVQIGGLQ